MTQVDAAKARLDAAAVEAATYAPDAYKAAQDTAAQLDAELAAQAGRFAPTRSYDRATELAASLDAAAGQLQQAVETEKTRLRTEAGRLTADARSAATEAQQSLDALPARRVPAEQAAAWRTDLEGVTASLAEVDSLLAGDQLAEANRQAGNALTAATGVRTAVAGVQAEIEAEQAAAAEAAARGDVNIPRSVSADGRTLGPGPYQLRLGDQVSAPAGIERWIEFVRDGAVAGRALAVVVPDAEIGEIAETQPPRNGTRVDQLREADYLRVWLNRDRVNYLIHMPIPGR
jgi:SWI/SNF-related matrix-associated actin-dependent regulator 1 of chromatin subfamily A